MSFLGFGWGKRGGAPDSCGGCAAVKQGLGATAARVPGIANAGSMPGGLIGIRTQVGYGGALGPRVPVLRPGWQYFYQRQAKLLHVPTVPPPIVYSAMHPVFIGPNQGIQGYVNTGASSYFTGGRGEASGPGAGPSWPFFFKPFLAPATFNKFSWQSVGSMMGQPVYNRGVLNVPRFGTIPNIFQPKQAGG